MLYAVTIGGTISMYLKKSTNSKTGRTQLSIVEGYRDAKGISRTRVVKNIGFLDVVEKEYDNPIAYFTNLAKQMTEEKKIAEAPVLLEINRKESLPVGTDNVRNYGYLAFSKIYHQLGIHDFWANRQRMTKAEYNLNSIFRALVFSRLIDPDSKKGSFEAFGRFFDKTDFSLDDLYRSLTFLKKYQTDLQLWIHEHIRADYGRDTSTVYYDVTNYYFETDKEDENKRKGVCKEHRPNPILQMGLFMDRNGLPISYGLFPGNTQDSQTLPPLLENVVPDYLPDRIIVVADRGVISGDNIADLLKNGNGYVFSYSIRSSEQSFKEYVLDEKGYTAMGDDGFRIKSRLEPRKIRVTQYPSGRKKQVSVDEKHVVFYSPDYAARAQYERALAVEKAKTLIQNPGKYNRSTSYGATKYIKNLSFDKKTGEIIRNSANALLLDEDLIAEEAKYDGYYAIVTSEYEKTDSDILDIYRGLWKIEETFKITKSELEARPVWVSTMEHILAHFMICYTALVISRILEFRIGRTYSVSRIIESTRKCNCALLEKNLFLFSYYDEVLNLLGKDLGIDFSRKYRTLKEIKAELAKTKK